MMKSIEAEDLATSLVTRWVTEKKDLDSIDTSLQYPLNRLKKFLARGTHEVILTLHPRSSDPCIVAQAGGNYLHIIVRYISILMTWSSPKRQQMLSDLLVATA